MTGEDIKPDQASADDPAQSDEANQVDEGGTTDSAVVDGDLEGLQASLIAAEEEVAKQKDAMLRMHAEMENLRKRLIRDLEKSRKRALEGFMNDLLPVRDSLARGLEAAGEAASVESLKEGKALILKMLSKSMEDHGLVEIDPKGEVFNPEFHEAMSMLPSAEYPANTVMEVIQRGYRLNERLIRPAMVVVSRGPE